MARGLVRTIGTSPAPAGNRSDAHNAARIRTGFFAAIGRQPALEKLGANQIMVQRRAPTITPRQSSHRFEIRILQNQRFSPDTFELDDRPCVLAPFGNLLDAAE